MKKILFILFILFIISGCSTYVEITEEIIVPETRIANFDIGKVDIVLDCYDYDEERSRIEITELKDHEIKHYRERIDYIEYIGLKPYYNFQGWFAFPMNITRCEMRYFSEIEIIGDIVGVPISEFYDVDTYGEFRSGYYLTEYLYEEIDREIKNLLRN